jgi:hypothetical protein
MTSTNIISILAGVILGALLFYFISKLLSRGKYVAAPSGIRFSESEAEGLLQKAGYQILGKRQKETVIARIDGKDHFGYIEADYTVRKNKRKYVAVVHSGEGEPDPNEPSYRRRLLEYDRVFSPEALLVLDLNQGEIHEVSFSFPRERGIDFFFRFLIALFIILMVVGIIWLLVQLRLI